MVFTFGISDGLAYAFRGLSGMALQPQVPCQANTDENVVIQAEIDLAGLLRAGPVPERSLKLQARIAMLTYKLECPSQDGICQGHRRRILGSSVNRPAELCIMQ